MSSALEARPHLLAFDFGWGHLKDHYMPCDECGGSGKLDEGDDENAPEQCHDCDGEGQLRWGSFYTEDLGECEQGCGRSDVPVAEMFAGSRAWTCLPCYVASHKRACGCGLWAASESRTDAGK
jgi:hypothetical protein